jgi:Fe-S-cluster containining protein
MRHFQFRIPNSKASDVPHDESKIGGAADPRVLTLAEFPDYVFRHQVQAARAILSRGRSSQETLELAERAHHLTDRAILAVRNASLPSRRPVCQPGCSACCHLHVVAGPFEVILIADYVRKKFTPAAQSSLLDRIETHIQSTAGMTVETRRMARPACPLLVDDRCSVYPVRPSACRGWNSLDVAACNADLQNPAARIAAPVNLTQYQVANRVYEASSLAVHESNRDARTLDLARALKIALEDPKASNRWGAGEQVFAMAAVTSVFPSSTGDIDKDQEAARAQLWQTAPPALRPRDPERPEKWDVQGSEPEH